MASYICNPINVPYRYQFTMHRFDSGYDIYREAADPSLILFHGRYYLFASMSLSVWVSDDLTSWTVVRLPDNLPLYDYAPDVRVIGDYVYFSASRRGVSCDFYRTRDVEHGPYDRIPGTFPFWDPNIFADDDGRIYFYWGCSCETPIWGVELDLETLRPLTKPKALIEGNPWEHGFERVGENHCRDPKTEEEIDQILPEFLKQNGRTENQITSDERGFIRHGILGNYSFIEGAWMTKHDGTYYLQYAATGAEYNVYCDGCYVGKSPLGPFYLADNAPYSYKPGGFLPGAGHGSTLCDRDQNWWHTATMRISVNNPMERRVGLWPAGFDTEGNLFCNQRYGDWPMDIEKMKKGPWADPDWMLLSYKKTMRASSFADGHEPSFAADENVQTCWQAAENAPAWIMCDLGQEMQVHAIQINLADDGLSLPMPGPVEGVARERCIDQTEHHTRWLLEGSADGKEFFPIEDKREAETDLTHDLVVREEGLRVRFVRLTITETAFRQTPCVSGLRIFGLAEGEKPAMPQYTARRTGPCDLTVHINRSEQTTGWVVLWGADANHLYHSAMTFEPDICIKALVKGRTYAVRVDAFNSCGIQRGELMQSV